MEILQYLHYHPLSKRAEIGSAVTAGISDRTLKRIIADCVTKGYIEVTGKGPTTKYKLTPQAQVTIPLNLDKHFHVQYDYLRPMKKLIQMKKHYLFYAGLIFASINANSQTSFKAISDEGLAAEFENASVFDGKSVVTVEKDNILMTSVAGTTPANNTGGNPGQQILADGTVLAWNEVKWDAKSKSEIDFYWIQGTGNPYTKLEAEEQLVNDEPSGFYKAKYTFYLPDGSNGMPVSGVYHKFTTKTAGVLKVGIWANKTNRNTFVVDESTMLPVSYQAEGYIDGQKDSGGRLKYLTNEEIETLHNEKFAAPIKNGDSNPYVIGNGAIFWGYITIQAEAGKTYWFFQDSSQLGLQGFEFDDGSSQEPDDQEEEINQAVPDYMINIETGDTKEQMYVRNIEEITFGQDNSTVTDANKYLIINRKDGNITEIELKDAPTMTFTDTTVTVKSANIDVTTDLDNITGLYFEKTSTGITGPTEEKTTICNEGAYIGGTKAGLKIYIYTTDGRIIYSATVDNGNGTYISFSSLNKNTTYILRTPTKSYKIVIR